MIEGQESLDWRRWASRFRGGDWIVTGYSAARVCVPFDPAQFVAANVPEFYTIAPGETALTHRTARIDGTLFNIFDSQSGADRFVRDNPDGDINVIVRRRTLMMRRDGFEMALNCAGVVSNAREAGVQASGQALLDEVEAMIQLEMA
jgi:hypothetical protein